MISFFYNVTKLFVVLVFPFILLIHGAVYLHFHKGLNTQLALLLSMAGAAVVLVIYFSIFYGRLTKKRTKVRYLRRRFAVSFLLIGFFVLHGIVWLSPKKAKTSEVEKEFSSLQPILRLGCSTIFLLDKKGIITDASREPEDYHKMGLKSLRNSLHYKQEDGYAYALDIRTKGRSELRNTLLKTYFSMMGFQTLRHEGTADHLHISMPCRYRKGIK